VRPTRVAKNSTATPELARHRCVHYLEDMNARARQLLDELLQLSAEDRALIADELDASLEEDADASPEDVEKAWAEEIERRADNVLAGGSRGRSADEVFAGIRARLAARQR